MCILEKNERINLNNFLTPLKGSEQLNIIEKPNITLQQFFDNTKLYMGNKFLTYSVVNNCQEFVLGCLIGNHINNPIYNNFIKQDASSVFKNNPNLRKFSNTLTDIAGKANMILQGGNIPINNKFKIFNKMKVKELKQLIKLNKKKYKLPSFSKLKKKDMIELLNNKFVLINGQLYNK